MRIENENMSNTDYRGLFEVMFSDGRIILSFIGLLLLMTGIFVCVQSYIGEFLPHDTAFLGMNAITLGAINPKIVNFMFHDRVSFGSTIMSTGLLYIWLAEFPIRLKQAWAWWVYLISGILGFTSFLTYIGHGYLDMYHAVSSLLLIPLFIIGLILSYKSYEVKPSFSLRYFKYQNNSLKGWAKYGYLSLIFTACGILAGGLVIMFVGMTTVYVPQDLEYMIMCNQDFSKINSNLTALIAHDRASFGGGLACVGLLIYCIINNASPSRNLWQILFIALSVGFLSVLFIHFSIGYTSFIHLLPAYIGTFLFYFGIINTYKYMYNRVDNV